MYRDETKVMKEAYGLLYEIENSLRRTITLSMKSEYGIDWLIQAPLSMQYKTYSKNFSSFYYHELISLLPAYPCIFQHFSTEIINKLQQTIPIRNKIAHTHFLTQTEFETLSYVYENLPIVKVF